MFEGIAGHWIPVATASQFSGIPYTLRVADEAVTLQRRPSGEPAAWIRVPVEGGRSRSLPLPVKVGGGLVWIHTDPFGSEAPLAIPSSLVPDEATLLNQGECDRPWHEAMKLLLADPTLVFLPTAPLGWRLQEELWRSAPSTIVNDVTGDGACVRWRGSSGDAEIAWARPNGLSVRVHDAGATCHGYVWCTPIDRERCRLFIAQVVPETLSAPSLRHVAAARRKPPTSWVRDRFVRWHQRFGVVTSIRVSGGLTARRPADRKRSGFG